MGQSKQKKQTRPAAGETRGTVHIFGLVHADRAVGQTPETIMVTLPGDPAIDIMNTALGGVTTSFKGSLQGLPNLTVHHLRNHDHLPHNMEATAARIGVMVDKGYSLGRMVDAARWIGGPAVMEWTQEWTVIRSDLPLMAVQLVASGLHVRGVKIIARVKPISDTQSEVYVQDKDAGSMRAALSIMGDVVAKRHANSN